MSINIYLSISTLIFGISLCYALLNLEQSMHEGQLVFSQITDHLLLHFFRRCMFIAISASALVALISI